MSAPLKIKADITGLAKSAEAVQRLRGAVARPRALYAHLAVFGAEKLRSDIASIQSHKTANRLGARPTEHLAKQARKIEGQSDDAEAVLLLPRASRLRAAFGTYTIFPGPGFKFLPRAAHKESYGKRPGELSYNLKFAMVGGRFPALVFDEKGALNGTVAYWLMRSATIEEDKTLIPFDLLAEDLAAETVDFIDEVINGKGGLA